MGNSASHLSRNSKKDKDKNSNSGTSKSSSNGNSKGYRGARPKFASPENRVLPVVPDGPQKLRRTDNGNILLSGGTISGRKNPLQNDGALTKFQQGKTSSSQPDNGSFVFGHRKSHSDPEIVRKMMEENETEEDDDGRNEGFIHRSRIALSPSKAKIKSRKKKKAPEPPQSNTLPRAIAGRNSLTQEIDQFKATHDTFDVPKRPLPPIPFDELPPPPPPPPPDYNRTIRDREQMKASNGKNFQKNRRVVEKWKLSKRNLDYFSEQCQWQDRSRNRNSQATDPISSSYTTFDESYSSMENVVHRNNSAQHISQDNENIPPRDALCDEIVVATRKRAERLARISMGDDLPLRAHKDHSSEALMNGKGNFELKTIKQDYHSQSEKLDFNGKAFHNMQGLSNTERSLSEQRHAVNNENHHGFTRDYQNFSEGIRHENHGENFNNPYLNMNGYIHSDTINGQLSARNPAYYRHHHETQHYRPAQENAAEKYNEQNLSYEQNINREKIERYSSSATNSHGITKQTSHLYCKNEMESETSNNRNHVFKNLSRVDRTQEITSESTQKSFPYNKIRADDKFSRSLDKLNQLDLGILPPLSIDKIAQNLRSPDTAIPIFQSTVSSSSHTEEEIEINLQIRPTLPRKPTEIKDFSATQLWKSINDHFFASHVPQVHQLAEVSSEDGERIKEEKIYLINRPVAPRRFIQDRSVDSGISPDSGSQMYLNETMDPSNVIIAHAVLCSTDMDLNDDVNTTWVPQQDLDESDCGSDIPTQNKFTSPNEMMQPKFAMPNLMFPSRSLPRTDNKNETENRDAAEKDKTRTKERRKRGFRNSETQHFNSLRNLKRALGISSKVPAVDVDGLDSNWSLSKSLSNFEDLNNLDAKIENEVPEISVLDHIRRSNSETRTTQQENGRIYSKRNSQGKNPEWRKSFPGQSSEGHVMYLPQYTAVPCHINANYNDTNNVFGVRGNSRNELSGNKINSETMEKNNKIKKKFSYQSTVRQLEKKKLEEQLAKEVEEKEKKRETEIEWMNIVEDEFRKQRVREKSDVKQKLRIYALEVNKQAKSSNFNNSQSYELNLEKNCGDSECHTIVPHHNILSHNNTESNGYDIMQDITKENNCKNSFSDFGANQYTQNIRSYSQGANVSQNFTQKNAIPKMSEVQSNSSQAIYQSEEVSKNNPENKYITQAISKSAHSQREKQAQLNDQMSFENGPSSYSKEEYPYIYRNNKGMDVGLRIEQNAQRHNISQRQPYPLSAHDMDLQVPPAIKDKQKTGKIDLKKRQRDSSSSVEENDGRRNQFNDNDFPNSSEQPTGMKKWLRRQSRGLPRPEPEGGRSSGDDGNINDGKRALMPGRSQPIGANAPNKCRHGSLQCGICKNYTNQNGLTRKDTSVSSSACGWTQSDKSRMEKDEIRPKTPVSSGSASSENQMNIAAESSLMQVSLDEYELHTKLCRTSSGRTFESHSYYALDRSRENSAECNASKKPTAAKHGSLFSSPNFKKELKENIRRKPRDSEKRLRKQPLRNYDSDETASDQERHYPRSKVHKKKTPSEHRGASFSRNHPHRSGARMKSNGHLAGDQISGTTSQSSAMQQKPSNSGLSI